MNERQKSVLMWLAFIIIAPAVALLLAFAVAAPLRGIHADSILGAIFYRIVQDFSSLQLIFGPLGVLLVAGLAVAASFAGAQRYFQIMAFILILGLASALALLYFIAFDSKVGPFISRNSGWDISPRGFRALAYPFLGWTFGALAGGLAALLGVTVMRGAPK